MAVRKTEKVQTVTRIITLAINCAGIAEISMFSRTPVCVALALLVLLQALAPAVAFPNGLQPDLHYGGKRPAEVRDPKLRKIYELIYPYYQRPKYRYPFYDHQGKGELLYGYGGPQLFRYTVFKPVEGYLRR